jgi:hypothetical protein
MAMFANIQLHGQRKLALIEAEKRQGRSKTYTESIPNEEIYMKKFYREIIFEKSLMMNQIMANYPDTVGEHYNVLVPDTVSFALFWARYFYRCCVDTIIEELIQQEQDRCVLQQCQRSAVIFPIECKKLRESIERGLGARPPEQMIESTGTSLDTSLANCTSSTPQRSNGHCPPRSSTPEAVEMGENDPYYMAIFHLMGNSTAQLQNQNNDAVISNYITPISPHKKVLPNVKKLFSSKKKARDLSFEEKNVSEILQV